MKRVIFMAFLILFATSLSTMAVEMAEVGGPNPDVPSFVGYAPNRIVVKFDPSILPGMDKAAMARGRTGIPVLDHLGTQHGVVSLLPQFPGARKRRHEGKQVDLAGWHKVKFSRNVDVLAVVEEYKAIPGVVDAQPVGIHRVADQYPNDEAYADWMDYQWQLRNIQAPKAWDIQRGNPAIIVAVLDTGVRYYHQDLGGPGASYGNPTAADGNMWINPGEIFGDGVDNDTNGFVDDWIGIDLVNDPCGEPYMGLCIPCCCYSNGNLQEDCLEPDNDPQDFNGHGTHCAGNVSAINNNDYAAASLSGGWGTGDFFQSPGDGVKVMALRIGWHAFYVFPGLEAGMVAMDYAAEALVYAADKGARIASCSWGSEDSGGIGAAIDYFVGDMGGLIFKAAGNDSTETADYMCARDDVICVAATDQNDCKASFSTYGTWIDVSAPGVQVGSLWHQYTDPGNDYLNKLDGTSMATPLAASVAALIWSQYPTGTAAQVRQRLFDSADPIDSLPCNISLAGKLGAGRINAFKAVSPEGLPPPNTPPVISSGPTATPSTITDAQTSSLSVTATDVDGDTLSYSWSATGGSVSGTGATAVYTPPSVTSTSIYTVSVTVSDGKGGTATGNVLVTVTPSGSGGGTNIAPQASVTASSQNAQTGQLAIKAVDGFVDGYPGDYTREWATVGQLAGAWITLEWSTFRSINQIKLYDRPNLADQVISGRLLFSDGSSINVGALPNNGSPFTVDFPTKSVTWVSFQIDSAVGKNIGLAEFEAYETGSTPSNTPPVISSGPTATPSTITDAQTSSLSVTASDADGDVLSYSWSATGGSVSGTGATAVYTPPRVTATTVYSVTVTVSDGKGGTASGSVNVTVNPRRKK